LRRNILRTLTASLLALVNKPYDEYNAVLTEIRTRLPLDVQLETFERVLGEELTCAPARRAYKTAILVAMGEDSAHREFKPVPKRAFGGKKH
jgi:hypothetical protein